MIRHDCAKATEVSSFKWSSVKYPLLDEGEDFLCRLKAVF